MRIAKTNDTTTVCASSHIEMSSFAVLMEPYYEEVCTYTSIITLVYDHV